MTSYSITERKITRRLFLSCFAFFPLVAAINASSLVSEASRNGVQLDWRVPWALEFTSIAAFIAPIALAVAFERRFRRAGSSALWLLIVLLIGSVVFSLLHITGMAALRAVVMPPLTGKPYQLLEHPIRDIIYEYRKDLFPYFIIIGLLTLYRSIWSGAGDRTRDAVEGSTRVELKSGGRTIQIDSTTVEWAQAAGNYVELRAAGQYHLPRITLSELEQRLQDAGIDAVRVHKSYIVNRRMIADVSPSGEGDIRIRLIDGSEIKGSRRYRSRLGM